MDIDRYRSQWHKYVSVTFLKRLKTCSVLLGLVTFVLFLYILFNVEDYGLFYKAHSHKPASPLKLHLSNINNLSSLDSTYAFNAAVVEINRSNIPKKVEKLKKCQLACSSCSKLYLDSNLEILAKGVHFNLTLQVLDKNSYPTGCGGDFIQAIMYSINKKKKKMMSIPANAIIDHKDGNYTITFYAAWSGRVKIEVVLVHTQQEVQKLIKYRNTDQRTRWRAIFKNNGRFSNSTFCTLLSKGKIFSQKKPSNDCTYTHATLGKIIVSCRKPKNFSCLNFFAIQWEDSFQFVRNQAKKIIPDKYLFERNHYSRSMFLYFNITRGQGSKIQVQCNSSLFTGYWENNNWNSNECHAKRWDYPSCRSCLENQDIYLFGDSTLGQWYTFLLNVVNLIDKANKTLNQPLDNIKYRYRTNGPKNNLTFIFHPWARRRGVIEIEDLKKQYTANVLDALPRTKCNYVVVISLWAHFAVLTLQSYTERLVIIREAVVRLLRDCPSSVVIVKGSHSREHSSWDSYIHSSDWLLYDMNRIMKNVFHSVPGVQFMDVWNLNEAFTPMSGHQMHMPVDVIREEIFIFLSKVCPKYEKVENT